MSDYVGIENLRKFYNKRIRVTDNKNNQYEGVFNLYTKPGDNDPEIESISLDTKHRYYDIDTPDIVNIEIID